MMHTARTLLTLVVAVVVPVAAALAPTPVRAQPACIAGTAADYFALGAQGCTMGGVTFGQFAPLLPFQDFDGNRLTLTPVTRAARGRAYVGFHMAVSAPLAASSAAALAVDRCGTLSTFCHSDEEEYRISLSASGAPLGIFASANVRGSTSSSGTWVAGAGVNFRAPRDSDDGDQQALGVIHGFASEAGEDFGARCRIPFANDIEFGGPTSFATQFCPTDIVARPPNGYYSVSLLSYVYSVTFGHRPPEGSATAELVSADVLFDVGAATTVPEPTSVALIAPALLAVGYAARRRRPAAG